MDASLTNTDDDPRLAFVYQEALRGLLQAIGALTVVLLWLRLAGWGRGEHQQAQRQPRQGAVEDHAGPQLGRPA